MAGSRNKTSNADLAAMPGKRIKGNASSSAAAPSDLTPEEAGQVIASQSGDGTKYLDGEGNFTTPGGSGGTPPDEVSIVTSAGVLKRAALTGDVTAAQGANGTTIANDAVTFAKMQNITTDRLVGRDTAGTGDPEELTVGGGLEFTGSGGIQRSALSGDVSASAGSGTTAIGANKVLDTMLRDSGALSIIGRSANSSGDPADISAVAGSGAVLRESGSSLGFGTVATAGIANDAIDDTKLRNAAALSVIGRSANSSGDPADISTSNGSDAVLRESGGTLGFGTVATGGIANDAVTDAKLRNSAALSVIGRSANSSGDPADIATSADGDVLRRSGTTLGFGTISASSVTNLADIQSFTTSGTFSGGSGWQRPSWATSKSITESIAIGAGGGGGGGGSASTAGAHQGGGGGGGGAWSRRVQKTLDLNSQETALVGAKGTVGGGGAGGGSNNGSPGGVGGTSSFGTTPYHQSCGGGGGSGGSAASNSQAGGGGGGVGGAGQTGTTSTSTGIGGDPQLGGQTAGPGVGGQGAWGGNSTVLPNLTGRPAEFGGGGGAGHNTSGSIIGIGGTSLYGGGGGGAGGSFTSVGPAANAPSAGGSSGKYDASGGGEGNAGTSGASPTAGTDGATGSTARSGGGGGGGGSALNNNTAGKNGGNGGAPGGGGGGGGSGNGTGAGGDGGTGGDGAVYVYTYGS